MNEYKKNNSKILYLIRNSKMVDGFFFSMICATVFTVSLFHWILDINYKYVNTNQSGPIVDFRLFAAVSSIIITFYTVKSCSIKFDIGLIILLQAMILIGIFNYHYEGYNDIPYIWILPMSYMLGKKVIASDVLSMEKRIIIVLFVLSIGIGIITFLDYANRYIIKTDAINRWADFMAGQQNARTTYDFGAIFVINFLGVFLLEKYRNRTIMSVVVALNIVIQYLAIVTQGREPACFLILDIFILGLVRVSEKSKEKKVGYFLWLLITIYTILVILLFVYYTNFAYIVDRYQNSYWSDGGGLINNQRIHIDIDAFKNIIKYPLEDFHVKYELATSHSMLLEYGRVYDLAIYGLLTIFRLIIVKDVFVYIKKAKNRRWMTCIVVPLVIMINMYYSLEPNGYFIRCFWMPGLLVSGIIRGQIEAEEYYTS